MNLTLKIWRQKNSRSKGNFDTYQVKDISSEELINGIKALGKKAYFEEDRNNFIESVRPHLSDNCVLLLMGARDPSLEIFTKEVYDNL